MRATRSALALALALAAGCSFEWDRYEPRADGADAGDPSDIVTPPADLGDDVGIDAPGADVPARCRASADCASDEIGFRVCDVPTGRCVQCTPTEDVCPPTQYCVAATSTCQLGCRSDEACLQLATDAGVTPADGGTGLARRCDLASRRCVACVTDEHCPIGTRCMGEACVPGCDATRGCPTGQTCCGGGCFDTERDPQHCGNCGTVCSTVNGVPACASSRCAVGACNAPYADCDGVAGNGCETDTLSSLAHCGACGASCRAPANAAAACSGGVCGLGACAPGFGDCDGDAMNGCETSLQTSLAHCGGCGRVCSVANGVAQCGAGSCQRASCNAGFADCDGDTTNGCEVNLSNDPSNCRSCGSACLLPRARAVCVASACTVGGCDTGYDNCDGNAANGCEASLRGDVNHCGACGRSCAFPRATALCDNGACAIDRCSAGYGNCDGDALNGCETDTTASLAHCGACNSPCAAPANATATCRAGACGFTCLAGFADCDGLPGNGCEVNLSTSVAHCGACRNACSLANADATCAAGTCQVLRCRAGFGDCDALPGTGCETDTTAALNHCGACGNACVGANSTQTCRAGACAVTACSGSYGNCDGVAANGCETDMATSVTNCGGCGTACAAGRTCNVGRCATASFAGYAMNAALTPTDIPFVDACALPGAVRVLQLADDDDYSGRLPFDVEYWGGVTRDFLINSNGVVGFGNLYYNIAAIPSRSPWRAWPTLPTTTGIVPGAYVYGVDLVTGAGGVCIATDGVAPNRRWIAEWASAQYYISTDGGPGTSVTFEVIVYESNRNVEFAYGPTLLGPVTPVTSQGDIVVGIQDFRPSPVRAVPYVGPVTPSTRIRFTPL